MTTDFNGKTELYELKVTCIKHKQPKNPTGIQCDQQIQTPFNKDCFVIIEVKH